LHKYFYSKFKQNLTFLNLVLFISIIFTAYVLLPCKAYSAVSEYYRSEQITAKLISAENFIDKDTNAISTALSIKLKPGWKTHWRSPGSVGLPPKINWKKSTNISETKFYWPLPERFFDFDIENYGYTKQVTFPMNLILKDQGKPTELVASVSLLVCNEVCIPEDFELDLKLTNVPVEDPESRQEISLALTKVPLDGGNSEFSLLPVKLDKFSNNLLIEIKSLNIVNKISVFPEMGPDIAFGPPISIKSKDPKITIIQLPILTELDSEVPLNLTISNGNTSSIYTDISLTTLINDEEEIGKNYLGLITILVFAFIGGLILNFMPCVLPVLAIKLSSILSSRTYTSNEVRFKFLVSALGILTFMWTLNGILLLLKVSGREIGWGIQFQSPAFLSFVILLLILFSLSMLGGLNILLPQNIMTKLNNLSRANGLLGDFLSGLFAAILATPCSAPFLGSAIAVALTKGGFESLLIFSFVGCGLATPYLLVALFPTVVKLLPKPGKWMNLIRLILGFLLSLTVIWFSWLYTQIESSLNLILLLIPIFLAIFSIKFFTQNVTKVIGFCGFAIIAIFSANLYSSKDTNDTKNDAGWEIFTELNINPYLESGKIVFVDITADWCLTCKANKLLVLENKSVQSFLLKKNIVKMRGDWTKKDPVLLKYLQDNGRYGIPFNIVYGPGRKDGIILPEILTTNILKEAIIAAH
jgi:suppressor for copper-sensitivity B